MSVVYNYSGAEGLVVKLYPVINWNLKHSQNNILNTVCKIAFGHLYYGITYLLSCSLHKESM